MQNIWKKYPDEKPEYSKGDVVFYRDKFYGLQKIWIGGHSPEFKSKKFVELNNADYWCYEADLIKTIGE